MTSTNTNKNRIFYALTTELPFPGSSVAWDTEKAMRKTLQRFYEASVMDTPCVDGISAEDLVSDSEHTVVRCEILGKDSDFVDKEALAVILRERQEYEKEQQKQAEAMRKDKDRAKLLESYRKLFDTFGGKNPYEISD